MLEYYFPQEVMRARIAQNPLSVCIEEKSRRFYAESYYSRYAKGYLQSMMRFGEWLQQKELPLCQVTLVHAREFLSGFDPPELSIQSCGTTTHRRQPLFAAVRCAMAWINEHHTPIVSPSPVQVSVEQYTDHLRHNRGLCEGSIFHHRQGLQAALNAFFGDGEIDLTTITSERIHSYIDRQHATHTS